MSSESEAVATSPQEPAVAEKAPKTVKCTVWCRQSLEMVDGMYRPATASASSMFVDQATEETNNNPDAARVMANTVCQSLATWSLARTKNTEDPVVRYHVTEFLRKVQEARLHLSEALVLDIKTQETTTVVA